MLPNYRSEALLDYSTTRPSWIWHGVSGGRMKNTSIKQLLHKFGEMILHECAALVAPRYFPSEIPYVWVRYRMISIDITSLNSCLVIAEVVYISRYRSQHFHVADLTTYRGDFLGVLLIILIILDS
jgi:hypothetical protein